MYQDKDLVDITGTTSQLGDPIQVGKSNENLLETAPVINYAMRVSLNIPFDIEIGKLASASELSYPGQPKIAKNSKGEYVVAYTGIESIYSNDVTSDPETDGWTDADGVGEFFYKNYYKVTTTDTSFHYIYKDLGYGNIFTESNDFALRYTFSLSEDGAYAGFGVRNGSGASNIGGAFFSLSSGKYQCEIKIGSTVYATDFELDPNNEYTLDIIHAKATGDTTFKVYSKDGLEGVITVNSFFTSAIAGSDMCIFTEAGSTTEYSFKVTGMQAWFNTIIVKKSIDNCKSWERTYSSVTSAGNEIGECSVGITSNGVIHLAWQYDDGTNYYLYYSSYDGSWSTPTNVANNTTIEKLNPVVSVSKKSTYLYIAWRELSASGTDIYVAEKDFIYSDEFEILVV